MSRPYLLAGFTRISFITPLLFLLLASACFCFEPAVADQKTNPEPVRTSLPAGVSTHASKIMMAPIMSPDERNAVYLQWGLVASGGLIAITGLVVWIFLNTRREAEENDDLEEENAYTVAIPPSAFDETKTALVAASESASPAVSAFESDARESAANKTDS